MDGDPTADVLLDIRHVSRQFAGIQAIDRLDLVVTRGELVGIIGPNGAGKTTLFNLVTGVVRPDAGVISFEGRSLVGLEPHAIARRGVARTFQRNRSFASLTVMQNIVLASHTATTHANRADRARDAMTLFELEPWANRRPQELPYGVLRRLELARALARAPSLLLLDEPAAGMNLEEIAWLAGVLREVKGRRITIVLIEHAMDLVLPVSDRVVVLDHGHKIFEGTPEAVLRDTATIEAYLGTGHSQN